MELAYTEVFEQWIRELRDQRARASILSRLRRIEEGNFGDHYRSAAELVNSVSMLDQAIGFTTLSAKTGWSS